MHRSSFMERARRLLKGGALAIAAVPLVDAATAQAADVSLSYDFFGIQYAGTYTNFLNVDEIPGGIEITGSSEDLVFDSDSTLDLTRYEFDGYDQSSLRQIQFDFNFNLIEPGEQLTLSWDLGFSFTGGNVYFTYSYVFYSDEFVFLSDDINYNPPLQLLSGESVTGSFTLPEATMASQFGYASLNLYFFWDIADINDTLRVTYNSVQALYGDENAPFVEGDTDGDGDVDFDDLGTLLGNYDQGGFVPFTNGDSNGDGFVDFNDLGLLLGNYGFPFAGALDLGNLDGVAAAPATVAVPEPGVGLPLLAAAAVIVGRRRR